MPASHRPTIGLLISRALLGLTALSGALGVVIAVVGAFDTDHLSREVRSRPQGVTIEDADVWLSLLDAAPMVVRGLVMIAVGWMLLIVVVDIQRGEPFDDKAARRLNASAVAIVVGVVVHAALSAWADIAVSEEMPPRHGRINGFDYYFIGTLLDTSVWLLIAALLTVFALAFREGSRLATDVKGLV